jgi:hypothetical protein
MNMLQQKPFCYLQYSHGVDILVVQQAPSVAGSNYGHSLTEVMSLKLKQIRITAVLVGF